MTKEIVQAALRSANHILANNEAAVADITRIMTNHEQGKRPFYIYCSKTGAKLGLAQQVVYEKRLAKFGGDLLNMFATYKGREPKVVVAPPATPAATNDIIIDGAIEVITEPELLALPAPSEDVIEVAELIEVAEVTAEEPEVVTAE